MPPWLILILVIAGMILLAALQAAACTGRWRTVWEAGKVITLVLLVMASPATVVGACMLLWRWANG